MYFSSVLPLSEECLVIVNVSAAPIGCLGEQRQRVKLMFPYLNRILFSLIYLHIMSLLLVVLFSLIYLHITSLLLVDANRKQDITHSYVVIHHTPLCVLSNTLTGDWLVSMRKLTGKRAKAIVLTTFSVCLTNMTFNFFFNVSPCV